MKTEPFSCIWTEGKFVGNWEGEGGFLWRRNGEIEAVWAAVFADLCCCCCCLMLLLLLSLLQQKGKRGREFWKIWMKRVRVLSNEIILFIPPIYSPFPPTKIWQVSLSNPSLYPIPYPINKAPCLPSSWGTCTPKYGEGYGGKVNNMWCIHSYTYIHVYIHTNIFILIHTYICTYTLINMVTSKVSSMNTISHHPLKYQYVRKGCLIKTSVTKNTKYGSI